MSFTNFTNFYTFHISALCLAISGTLAFQLSTQLQLLVTVTTTATFATTVTATGHGRDRTEYDIKSNSVLNSFIQTISIQPLHYHIFIHFIIIVTIYISRQQRYTPYIIFLNHIFDIITIIIITIVIIIITIVIII